MRLLVLGGTSFVGRAIVEDALLAGAEVTIFSRGRTGTNLFPDVARFTGDRDTDDYAALAAGAWDAVVDTTAYVPRHIAGAMNALGDRVGRYLFISSHAVYQRTGVSPGADETTPLRPEVRDTEDLTEQTYGPLKVACENDITARYGSHTTIVRPCRVAGPHDNQDAFTYWVRRAARGGRVALPGAIEQPAQIIDSRDLARLVTRLVTDDQPGVYQAVGPSTTLSDLIHTCAAVAGATVEIVPVPPDAAPARFPLVRPESMWTGQQRDPAKARAAGMPITPLTVTAADVLAWDRARGEPPLSVGFSGQEEQQVLARHGGVS